MSLSVIIPTCNRADLLAQLFRRLKEQDFSTYPYEVLVIDNGSTDNTRQLCEEYQASLPNFQYIYESRPGLHQARHTGWLRSSGDIQIYVDDDVEPFPTWLQGIAAAFESGAQLVGGKCLPKFESPPPDWLKSKWGRHQKGNGYLWQLSLVDLGDHFREISPFLVLGCNFSVRRQVLMETRGFHPDAMPPSLVRFRGDGETYVSEYVRKRGYKTIYHPMASVYHWVPKERMTVAYFCKRAYLQGISDSFRVFRKRKGVRAGMAITMHVASSLPRALIDWRETVFLKAYWTGFGFHQIQVRKDPELRRWVLRENFLEP
jgi:glycosyltransferase involved in cell wall biosynthesis